MPELYRFKKREDDYLRVGVWHITESSDELRSLAAHAGIKLDATVGMGEKRMKEWIASRLLAKNVLDKGTKVHSDENGKPFLEGMPGYISIAHTDGYAVVLYSVSVDVGVDLERRDRDALSTCRRYMNDAEMSSLAGARPNDTALLHWAVKEALFKVTGDVGGTFKDNITLNPFILDEVGTVTLFLHDVNSDKAGKYIAWYAFEKDVLFALCFRLRFNDNV